MDPEQAAREGLLEYFNPEPEYLAHAATLIDVTAIRNAGLNIVVDSMHGAGAGYFNKLLGDGNTRLVEIRGDPDPAFPGMAQPEPIIANLGSIIDEMLDSNADVGLATDGDADRLGVIDENGRFMTTLEVFPLLCLHLLENMKQTGPLVRSITMTSMIDRLGALYNVPVFDTPVGFKYLGPVMMAEEALAAGEESGGYAFRGNIPERDGILSGLLFLDMMVKTSADPSNLLKSLFEKVGPHSYDRWDVKYDPARRDEIQDRLRIASPSTMAGRAVTEIDQQDGFRFVLEGGYWALVRFSGTEPLLRIYAEGESPDEVSSLLAAVHALARA
ncbi:phosphoglucomutase/phosphomannomutase family protein [Dehalococcoidia bacterium]|nr:phosphoglucomutase/phosphomannomutase family protein [Dehalococcoidia bacterium]